MVTLYGSAFSTFTWSARLALTEKGVPYEMAAAKLRTPEWGLMHPYQRMPVLDHDGFRVFEAAAVMNYVDEAFEGPALKPADAHGRARMWQWASAFSDYVAPSAVRGVLIPRFVLAARGIAVDDAAVHAAAAKAHTMLEPFEAALGTSSYLAGEKPSIADYLLLPVVATGGQLEGADQYSHGLPSLNAWRKRMAARPSFAACLPR